MISLEMVEKLRQRANVSYDEAKYALEACGGDILDAMIYLEQHGRVSPPPASGYYSTQQEPPYQNPDAQSYTHYQPKDSGIGSIFYRLWNWLLKIVEKGNRNNFEVHHNNKRIICIPLTALVLLSIACFWVVIPALVIGLFAQCTYECTGPDFQKGGINEVMHTASRAADSLKNELFNKHNQQ